MGIHSDKGLSFCDPRCALANQSLTNLKAENLLLVNDAIKDLSRTAVEVYQIILVTFQFVLTIAATGPFEVVDG